MTRPSFSNSRVAGAFFKTASPRAFFARFFLLLATLCLPALVRAQDYTYRTLAGTPGRSGSQDGQNGDLNASTFNFPFGIALGPDGNLYVTDTGNSLIRKVTPAGAVTTFVGKLDTFGGTDGSGTNATFNRPHGPVFDRAGNLYVADYAGATIRKITPAGAVTTLAGTAGTAAYVDGTGAAARFSKPSSLAVDATDNLYVADSGNHVIRKITPAGVVTTLAGTAGTLGSTDGVGAAARFNNPRGIVCAADGTLYVADTGNNSIRKIAPDGTVTTLAGMPNTVGGADGAGSAARFNFPNSITLDQSGNLIVADENNCTIRRVTTAGVVTTVAGVAGAQGRVNGSGANARFNQPTGVAVDGTGNIYVVDYVNQLIRRIAADGNVTTVAGTGGNTGSYDGTGYSMSPVLLRNPTSAAVDAAGNVYIADTLNHSIRKITSSGLTTLLAGDGSTAGSTNGTGAAARFHAPVGIALDAAGNAYVADAANHLIRKISSAGEVTTLAGKVGEPGHADGAADAARFDFPSGVAVDGAGNVYVVDYANHVIRQIAPGGAVTTLAGAVGQPGSDDGVGGSARFRYPRDIALDASGNLYVADTGNSSIRRISPGGLVVTLAGSSGATGAADGTGGAARFENPAGLGVDAGGNIFVADSGNSTLRKITPGGVVTTIGGSPGNLGTIDGVGTAARFNHPTDIAVNAAGTLYIVDNRNHTIRKGTLPGSPDDGDTGGGSGGGGGGGGGSGGGGNGGGAPGDGTVGTGILLQPVGMAADAFGNLYVADTANHVIRRIGQDNVVTVFAGRVGSAGSADGKGDAARFNSPMGIAFDGGNNLIVADSGNFTIRKIASDGGVTTLAGLAGSSGTADGKGDAARFGQPWGVAYGAATGDMFVTDPVNATLRRVTADGTVTTFAGTARVTGDADGVGAAARFNNPTGIVYEGNGFLVIADTYNNTLRVISTTRRVVSTVALGTIGTAGTVKVILTDAALPGGSVQLDVPVASGDISGTWAGKVVAAINANTTLAARYTASNSLSDIFLTYNVGVDESQTVNISLDNGTATGVTPRPTSTASTAQATVRTFAGSAGISGAYDGPGEFALFNLPQGMGVDTGTGSLFVADTGNNAIRRISNLGLVSTVAGMAGISGNRSGNAEFALFNQPKGVGVFASGSVLVTDTGNSILRLVTLNATTGNKVSTLALTNPPSGGSGGGDGGSGGGGGGGGGGSHSLGFLTLLFALTGLRHFLSRRRRV